MGDVDVSVKWPFKWCLVGSSGSGKTIFSLNLVKNIHRIVDIPPTKIVLIFKEYQKQNIASHMSILLIPIVMIWSHLSPRRDP